MLLLRPPILCLFCLAIHVVCAHVRVQTFQCKRTRDPTGKLVISHSSHRRQITNSTQIYRYVSVLETCEKNAWHRQCRPPRPSKLLWRLNCQVTRHAERRKVVCLVEMVEIPTRRCRMVHVHTFVHRQSRHRSHPHAGEQRGRIHKEIRLHIVISAQINIKRLVFHAVSG